MGYLEADGSVYSVRVPLIYIFLIEVADILPFVDLIMDNGSLGVDLFFDTMLWAFNGFTPNY